MRRIFQNGSFLVSYERLAAIPTFHMEVEEAEMSCEVPKVIDSNFETSIAIYKEHSCFKANMNGNAFERKCVIIIGFNILEEDSYNYFVDNWRELSGLGNVLDFLTPKYFVSRVSLLINSEFTKNDGHLHFMVLVELFFNANDLIYLLDFVQKFRNKRNTGYVSIYGEFPARIDQPSLNNNNTDNNETEQQ